MDLLTLEPQEGAALDHALLVERAALGGDAELQSILAEHMPRFRMQVHESLASQPAGADGGTPWLAYVMWQENAREFH